VPPWNRTLTASQQWVQAKSHWTAVLGEWRREATNAGAVEGKNMGEQAENWLW